MNRSFAALALTVVAGAACASTKHAHHPPGEMAPAAAAPAAAPEGFVSLFNGKDLTGWKIPAGDNGHWKVIDGVIDYDALSEAPYGKKDLWSDEEYGDFVLRVDWRLKEAFGPKDMRDVLPDGTDRVDDSGKPVIIWGPDADSGIYLRGNSKSQVNIWLWPVGSGEVYGYRMDKAVSPEVRAGVTPKMKADKPLGEWNSFEITMKGDRLTVVLNGKTVIESAQLPGVPASGPIGLQHHGGMKDGKYQPASSLVQFRNIFIKRM